MLKKLSFKTKHKSEMIQITNDIKELVIKSGIKDGTAVVFTPHTTASVLLFENNDPNLSRDFLKKMAEFAPVDTKYAHIGKNAHAHIKSGALGGSITLIIEDANVILGQWQGIYLADFDGPREREVYLKIVG
jgi:secondary thiamine-phosphate synthase enzyme